MKYLIVLLLVGIVLVSGCGGEKIPVVSTERAICRASCSIDDPRLQFCSASDECYIPFEQEVKIFTECSNCEYGAVGCQACSTIKKGNKVIFDCTTHRDSSPKLEAGTYKLNTQATCGGNALEIKYKETEEAPVIDAGEGGAPSRGADAGGTMPAAGGASATEDETAPATEEDSNIAPSSTTCSGPIIGSWLATDWFVNYESMPQKTGIPVEKEITTYKEDCSWTMHFPEKPEQDNGGTYGVEGNKLYYTGTMGETDITFVYFWAVDGNILRLRLVDYPEGFYEEYTKQ